MKFSEKYPEKIERAEEEIKKQVESLGLNYETIKKDTDRGFIYEADYFGIVRFGLDCVLRITPFEPAYIPYESVFWAYGEKRGFENDIDCIILMLTDGNEEVIELNDKEDEKTIFDIIKKSSPDTLIGYSEENNDKFEAYKKRMNIEDISYPDYSDYFISEPKAVPEPVPKLPEKCIESMREKFEYIISMSKKLAEMDNQWYYKTFEPLSEDSIRKWCKDNGAYLPEVLIMILTRTDSFCVDYASTTGYFHITSFSTEMTTEELFGRTREKMLARDYDYYKNCQVCFGWLHGQCLYYNPYTGEMFIEKERYQYTPIEDFEKEILDKVISWLEKKIVRFESKDALLSATIDNPLREQYEKLLEYRGDSGELNTSVVVYEPLSADEIAEWETSHGIQLPQEYKDWLLLSDGADFSFKHIYSLEDLDPDNPAIGPDDDKEYIIIANLSGFSDCLVFDPDTAELFVLTDDGEREEGDFVSDIFEDGFEYLEEELEVDEEDY
jgi:hypothetical protein